MSNPEDPKSKSPEPATPSPAVKPSDDSANQTSAMGADVSGILRRWKREDMLKRGSIALRGSGFLFSLLTFIIMASNKHGDWKDFDKYEEYSYVLAIAILSTLYTGGQTFRQIRELSTGKELFSRRNLALLDFFGDQIGAYLLISAASSAIPLTNRMREGGDNIFTDSSATAIAMEILAFIALALSSMISGFKLSHQSYI